MSKGVSFRSILSAHKHIAIQQDNLEFCQWLKAFYDQSGVFREDYDPIAVRSRGKGGKKYKFNKTGAVASRPARPATRTAAPVTAKTLPSKPAAPKPVASKGTRDVRPLRERQGMPGGKVSKESNGEQESDPALLEKISELEAKNLQLKTNYNELEEKNADLEEKKIELEANVENLEEAVMDLEKERDFYFSKLRSKCLTFKSLCKSRLCDSHTSPVTCLTDTEVLLQIFQESEGGDPNKVIDDVFKILYAVRTRLKSEVRDDYFSDHSPALSSSISGSRR